MSLRAGFNPWAATMCNLSTASFIICWSHSIPKNTSNEKQSLQPQQWLSEAVMFRHGQHLRSLEVVFLTSCPNVFFCYFTLYVYTFNSLQNIIHKMNHIIALSVSCLCKIGLKCMEYKENEKSSDENLNSTCVVWSLLGCSPTSAHQFEMLKIWIWVHQFI